MIANILKKKDGHIVNFTDEHTEIQNVVTMKSEKVRITMQKYQYKVVRSYTDGCALDKQELERAFKDGYEFVRASEVVENSNGRCNYIEYILRKENASLDDMIAEINNLSAPKTDTEYQDGFYDCEKMALDVIDKYCKGET